jgi:preprotein translocase subunit YajC
MDMISNIKVGDLVKTAGGIIGKITKITEKGEIKTVILETGSKTEKSYMEFDMSMIYCVMKSTKVEEPKEEVEEAPAVEEAPVEAETKAEEPKKAPAKKTAAKKTTAKKSTTAKKTTKKS